MTLKKGVIIIEVTLKYLVNTYGSDIHKSIYENGNLVGGSRKSFLTHIKRYIDYEESGKRGHFKINHVYDIKKPMLLINFSKHDIHYHVARMIVFHLNSMKDLNHSVIPKVRFANNIQFINSNFNKVRFNRKDASELLQIEEPIIKDFTKKAIENMEAIIETTLKALKSDELIEYLEQYMVSVTDIEFNKELNKNVTVARTRRASEIEVNFILKAIEDTKKKFNISTQEIYFSKNKSIYNEYLTDKLKTINIDYYFKGYEIYIIDKDKILEFLSWYSENIIENVSTANSIFISKLNSNTSKRIENKNINKLDYMSKYLKLCNQTIPYDSEILDINYKDSYNVSVDIINNGMGVNVDIERSNLLD